MTDLGPIISLTDQNLLERNYHNKDSEVHLRKDQHQAIALLHVVDEGECSSGNDTSPVSYGGPNGPSTTISL